MILATASSVLTGRFSSMSIFLTSTGGLSASTFDAGSDLSREGEAQDYNFLGTVCSLPDSSGALDVPIAHGTCA